MLNIASIAGQIGSNIAILVGSLSAGTVIGWLFQWLRHRSAMARKDKQIAEMRALRDQNEAQHKAEMAKREDEIVELRAFRENNDIHLRFGLLDQQLPTLLQGLTRATLASVKSKDDLHVLDYGLDRALRDLVIKKLIKPGERDAILDYVRMVGSHLDGRFTFQEVDAIRRQQYELLTDIVDRHLPGTTRA